MKHELSEECYTFSRFRLYPQRRTLLLENDIVSIGGRAFDLLLILVSQAGTVLSAKDLMALAWPQVMVEQANLRVQMGLIRKILAKCEEARRSIETVAMRGYCFILPVQHHLHDLDSEIDVVERTHLPALYSPIIGREDAITIIGGALDERRLVTVTGPGGIGKTTVSIAIAYRQRTSYKGDIRFVDLSHVPDTVKATAGAIAKALGTEIHDDPLSSLRRYLRDREMLLILDTCEHVVESIAAISEDLLGQCPKLRLLVTSREALRAAGEWTHRLPSLTFPERGQQINEADMGTFSAIKLFVERIQSSMQFRLRSGDCDTIAEICRRLDGIPLALELAAARVPDLGLQEIAARLDDRFSILNRGRRTALPRHRTLSAAFDWSFSLLSADEQRMLRHLAELDGGFTVEHAIASAHNAGCERPPEALAGLVEKSLISIDIRNDAPIYRLFDTTKAYVASIPG